MTYRCGRVCGCSLLLVLALALPALAASAAGQGAFYLVSTGVGDADNMSVRAWRTIERADVVLAMQPEQAREKYAALLKDKPVYPAGHGLFGRMPQRLAVASAQGGRRPGPAAAPELADQQQQTRQIVRDAVAAGKTVVLLDAGDPTIYGPQTGYLREFADLAPQVIPGISSFNAANAALGRGITEGRPSRSVILTAAAGKTPNAPDGYHGRDSLTELAKSQSTLVFFTMGLNLPDVVAQLKTSYPADTPIALVLHAGSAARQRVVRATLESIVAQLGDEPLPFEHLIYVGDFLR
ncbi:SAM-dependent methyltransferase [Desulfuromonas thiophila]|uniref:SAM-dependent methyltransferase n=1 Tax=Desulfuromonas thiophila TaxID=57664 RepID=UPI0029F470B5|nr:SAM-dependent methyltransferase [Desulfuromonas thiophila]